MPICLKSELERLIMVRQTYIKFENFIPSTQILFRADVWSSIKNKRPPGLDADAVNALGSKQFGDLRPPFCRFCAFNGYIYTFATQAVLSVKVFYPIYFFSLPFFSFLWKVFFCGFIYRGFNAGLIILSVKSYTCIWHYALRLQLHGDLHFGGQFIKSCSFFLISCLQNEMGECGKRPDWVSRRHYMYIYALLLYCSRSSIFILISVIARNTANPPFTVSRFSPEILGMQFYVCTFYYVLCTVYMQYYTIYALHVSQLWACPVFLL